MVKISVVSGLQKQLQEGYLYGSSMQWINRLEYLRSLETAISIVDAVKSRGCETR